MCFQGEHRPFSPCHQPKSNIEYLISDNLSALFWSSMNLDTLKTKEKQSKLSHKLFIQIKQTVGGTASEFQYIYCATSFKPSVE